jgi:nucleoside-diphosphate-sugar epimerase
MKILITGAKGFLGSFLTPKIEDKYGKNNTFIFGSSEYDLRNKSQVNSLFEDVKPDKVVHLAAVVGGIGANRKNPGKFFYENMLMGLNLVEACREHQVKKVVNIGTVCSYPKILPVPFKEQDFWNGYPEETNAPYGIAKKAIIVMLQSYYQQYGLNSTTLLPCNLYGPGDNFDLESSHVIPAMIRKIHDCQSSGEKVTFWGDGSPTREFLYVDDAADAIIAALKTDTGPSPINIGSGIEIKMWTLATHLKDLMEYNNDIIWNTDMPNGQPRRWLDTSKSEILEWKPKTNLAQGLKETIKWYKENHDI